MLIKESTFKRILREEFRNLLGEASLPLRPEEVQSAIRNAGNNNNAKMIMNFYNAVKTINGAILKSSSVIQDPGAKAVLAKASQNLSDDVQTNGAASTYAQAVVGTLATMGNSPPNVKWLAVMASLATAKQFSGQASQGQADYESFLGYPLGNTNISQDIPALLNSQGASLNRILQYVNYMCKFDLLGIYEGIAPQAGPASTSEYVVKAGDSVSKILQDKYGINPSKSMANVYVEFAKLSGIPDVNKIDPGQKLNLPPTITAKVGGESKTYSLK